MSKSQGRSTLARYFPELRFCPGRYVLDGELVIRDDGGGLTSSTLLQSRIHPARSRIELLAEEIPADYIAFDLLAEGDETLFDAPLQSRRQRLEGLARSAAFELTPLSADEARAENWLASIEGAMAKGLGAPYIPGNARGWRRSSESELSTAW